MERLDNVAPQEVEHHEDYYAYCMDCAEILTENRSENIAEIYAGDHCSVFGHQVMVARSMREPTTLEGTNGLSTGIEVGS